jgi:hypothetical protein
MNATTELRARPSVPTRILAHLAVACPEEPSTFGASNLLTQDGMAHVLGKARGHIANELERLERRGLVQQKLSHVLGRSRCVRVYYLTYAGRERARELRECLPGLFRENRLSNTTMAQPCAAEPTLGVV